MLIVDADVLSIFSGDSIAIPSARDFGSYMDCHLIRINPSEHQVGLSRDISISLGAQEALIRITDALKFG